MKPFQTSFAITRRPKERQRRGGHVLTLVVVSLAAILGVVGLVLDGGMLFSNAQNLRHATDAAATAAAMDLLLGKGNATAKATALNYIQTLNGFSDATVTVNIPPTQGAYAGLASYVEVIAVRSYPMQIMQIVCTGSTQNYQVRAVAGYATSTTGGAIDILDPSPPQLSVLPFPPYVPAYSGLLGGMEVLGLGAVSVNGAVLANTTWGGVDEHWNPAGVSAGPPYGISCTPLVGLTHLNAHDIRVVGGVDAPTNYGNYTYGVKSPLKASQLPIPDPFISLPVPTTTSDPTNVKTQYYGGVTVVQLPVVGAVTTLQPGVYDWIEVDSGTVVFQPGVYIIRNVNPITGIALTVLAGQVTANGVMFYITNSPSYDAVTGLPDSGDGETRPATPSLLQLIPAVVINAALPGSSFSPISSASSPYNGILLFQRRADFNPVAIVQTTLLGASFSGTLYAKWGQILFTGIGSYDVRIVAGTVRLITAIGMSLGTGSLLAPAQDVFLVE